MKRILKKTANFFIPKSEKNMKIYLRIEDTSPQDLEELKISSEQMINALSRHLNEMKERGRDCNVSGSFHVVLTPRKWSIQSPKFSPVHKSNVIFPPCNLY